MKTSKEIRELIAALMDRVTAITATAKEEKRDLSAEEKAEVDRLMGAGDQPGELGKLEADLKRAEKIEAKQKELAASRAPNRQPEPQTDDNGDPAPQAGDPQASDIGADRAARIVIPIQARHQYRQLRAFSGEHAQREAFITGMWALGTLGRNESARDWCNRNGIDTRFRHNLFEPQNAAAGNAAEKGGYLVPVETERAIIRLREEYGVFRRNARIVPMAGDTKTQPVRTAGLTAYWGTENPSSALTDSDMTYSNVELVAKKLYAFSKYSTEIAEDAIVDFGDELADEAAVAIAYAEDLAAFLGTGTSTYGGVVGIITALQAGSEVTATTGNTAFSTLDLADFEAMIGKLPMYPGIQPKWYISQPGWAASMLRLQDAAGGNTAMMLGGEGRPMMFLGYPVEITQVMNSTLTAQTSTEGICHFGDLRLGAVLGDRRGIAMAISDQRYFDTDQLAIRIKQRVDIVIHSRGDASNPGAILQMLTPGS